VICPFSGSCPLLHLDTLQIYPLHRSKLEEVPDCHCTKADSKYYSTPSLHQNSVTSVNGFGSTNLWMLNPSNSRKHCECSLIGTASVALNSNVRCLREATGLFLYYYERFYVHTFQTRHQFWTRCDSCPIS
jgi:hypothetical protein